MGKPDDDQVDSGKDRGERLKRCLIHALGGKRGPTLHAIENAEAAAKLVGTLIYQRKLAEGDAIPAETLADGLHIHRNTANKAIGLLAEQGYVLRRRGRSARVVTNRPNVPDRKSAMISHTAVALEADIPISTDSVFREIRTLDTVEPRWREPLQQHLSLGSGEKLITLVRVRKMRMDAMTWTPAIAEYVFMRAALLPAYLHDELINGEVESLRDFFVESGFDVINSAYRIRIARLPKDFRERWAEATGLDIEEVDALRFLELESTTHCPQGPISFSTAYLLEDLYVLSTADFRLRVEVRRNDRPSNGAAARR